MAFVGRGTELDLILRQVVLGLETSSGRTVFVGGPPGAGKTSLVTEVLARIGSARSEVRIARGRCLQSFGCADPYLPFVEALSDLTDENTSGSVERETVAELLTELAPYWLSVVPLVGNLLSATVNTAQALRGKPKTTQAPSREALFIQYLELIKRLARDAPLVLFLDDLQWADQSSLALLTHVARGVAALPVVILGTMRSDEIAVDKHPLTDLIRELEREDLATRLEVKELEGEALEALLRAELGGDVSEPLRRWLTGTAGGNPLFASELCRMVKQSGVAEEVRGEWHLRSSAGELEVPRSAEAVIEWRIDKLDPDSIRTLQYASVQGIDFTSTMLATLLEEDELDLLDRLEKIERKNQLVRTTGEMELPDGDVATTFRFSNALVQTVLYRKVVGKRRILLHRKAGEVLERLFGDAPAQVANELARHFHEGRIPESAYRYSSMAGEAARRVYAHWEAEEFLRLALQHSPGAEETVRLEEMLGDVYETVGFYPSALERFGDALGKSSAGAGTDVRLKRKILGLERKLGSAPAPELLSRARTLLPEARPYPEEHCRLLIELSLLPDVSTKLELAAEALALAEELSDPGLLLSSLERIAGVLVFSLNRIDEAFVYLSRALRVVESIGDPLRAALYYNISGIAHAKIGQFAASLTAFHRMLELSEQIGDPRKIAIAHNNIGRLMLALGRYPEAEESLSKADLIHERRDRSSRVHSLLNLAECARLHGQHETAISRFEAVASLATEFEYWESEAVAYAGLGLSYLAAGRIAEARAQAPRLMGAVADRQRWFENRDLVELFLSRLEILDGDADAAIRRLQAAADATRADLLAWARLEVETATILAPLDAEKANQVLARLTRLSERMECPPLLNDIIRIRDSLAARVRLELPLPTA